MYGLRVPEHSKLGYIIYEIKAIIKFMYIALFKSVICMYRAICMVITYSIVWINRVRLPILLVVS